MGDQLRDAANAGSGKRVALVVGGKEKKFITIPAVKREQPPVESTRAPAPAGHAATAGRAAPSHDTSHEEPAATTQATRSPTAVRTPAKRKHDAEPSTASHHGDAHWSYEGNTGPSSWGRLNPEFSLCGNGKRQSPINIEESQTLRGPAEALQFQYSASNASVVNNGHTVQIDVSGDNNLTVRGSTFRLVQFHFHTPSEEQVNFRSYPLDAHLVHRNSEGQLAVVAVLFDVGATNPLIQKVWTYMPLDTNDRVNMPTGLLDLNEVLPKDQRYYQFIGSLTTPPCTEGVLWMVLKQPVPISREQLRLFTQLFPRNARPVQPLNGRPVRDAQ